MRGGETLRLVWKDLALMAGDTACVCGLVLRVGVADRGEPWGVASAGGEEVGGGRGSSEPELDCVSKPKMVLVPFER